MSGDCYDYSACKRQNRIYRFIVSICVKSMMIYCMSRNFYMQASYKKLWKLLIDKDIKKSDLLSLAGISSNIMSKMNKGEDISMDSLRRICSSLSCDIGDIVSFE